MATTEDLRFARPHELTLGTSVIATKMRRDRLRVSTLATIAETTNPEGGDVGTLSWASGSLRFDRVFETPDGLIWHDGELDGVRPEHGDACVLWIDHDRRLHNEAHHSFSHLLTAVSCKLAGRDLIGSSVVHDSYGELQLHDAKDLSDLLPGIWRTAIEYLAMDDPTQELVLPIDEGLARVSDVYRAVIPRGLTEIRLVRVGHDLRWIPCRGVHLENLRQILMASGLPADSTPSHATNLIVCYSLSLAAAALPVHGQAAQPPPVHGPVGVRESGEQPRAGGRSRATLPASRP